LRKKSINARRRETRVKAHLAKELHLSRGLPPGNRWEAQGPKVKIADELHHRRCCCCCSVFNGIEKRSDEDLGRKFKKTFNCQPLSHRATEPHKLRTRVYERRVSFFLRNANRGYRKIAPNECNNSKNTFIKWQLSALGRCSRSPRNWVSRRSRSEANTSPPLCL